MSEITDKDLASIYSSLSSCSPLVRGLAERLRRVEGERDDLRGKAEDSDTSADSYFHAFNAACDENTALRERMKRIETLLNEAKEFCLVRDCDGDALNMTLARKIHAALKEGGE